MSKDKSSNTTKQEKNTQDTQEKLAYNPKSIESTIYQICKNRGYFEIDGNSGIAKKRQARLKQHSDEITPKDTHFCIMMPPPNVTGVLHIGHALTLSLQDIIVRYKRMQGFVTLYQPGLDHAGIATQNIVEKQLLTKGVKKEELGREAFINKVWEWKEESGGKILGQMEALGITPALSRTRFTMDKGLQQAVREAFVAWYEKGLIYQGDYMVNWCTHDGALSDIEVHYEGQETKLYYIAYKIANGNSSLGEGNSSNSPAGSHCIDLLDFESSQTLQSSSPPKSSKNSTSTTLRARIVGENGGDTCHTEEAQATEVSQTQLKNRDISGLSPQYDKDINSPSLAEGALAWVDSNNSPSPNCQNVAEVVESRNDTNDTFPQDALVVATTRPETFFGDVAVMINPNDSRYAHLIGQKVILPLLNKEIPIIADNAVDMEFGTGIVKVTPAHDINDYEVGKRHGLENLVIFDEKGILNENALDFAGRERLEARDDIVSALKSCGALLKTEPYHNQVGTCYRCGNIIEPYISKQWFVSKEVAKNAIKRVNDGESRFYPSSWLNNFNAWMRELRPWCISRQLWWGHRIPIWDCENPNCAHRFASKNEVESSCPKCGGEVRQDSDVLDTWFSSGLWAFSTLGWGNSNNSPLGMQCGKILDFLECTDAKSANIPKNPKNLHSHTANTRIVDSSKQADSSENGNSSSLDKNPQDSRGNLTQNDKTNSPSLAEGVRGRVDSNAELSLQDSESERGKTRQSRSFFSNLNGIASDFKNAQLKIQGDCHAQQVALAMTEKRDCHESAYADSRNDEKTREFNADFDKSISNDNVACRPEGVGKNARSILKTQNRDFSLIAQNDNDRDISGLSPQYGKDIECYDIDCVKSSMHNGTNEISTMPKSLHFTLKARANTNALLANAKAQITGIIQSLLENQTSISPNIRISNQYSAWANQNDSISNATSPILQIIIDAYKWRHCEVGSIHAGLECGILQERFKQMGLGEIAMASIGPSIFSPHSLQERLDLGSFEEFIEVLKCALDNICTQNI